MRMPSKAIIQEVHAKFEGFAHDVLAQSPNCLPICYTKGEEKYFVKIVDKDAAIEEGTDEIELRLKEMSNDHLVKLVDSGDLSGGFMYLQFEHIEGKTVEELDKPFDQTELIKLGKDIGEAIAELWKKGIVHRDIKPKNIMKEDSTGRYILVDLGIGYFVQEPYRDNTKKSKSNGSRFYSAPEQFLSNQDDSIEVTFSADEFSLGLVLFEAATGVHPYKDFDSKKYNNYGAAVSKMDPPKLEMHREDLDGNVVNTINTMLSTEPADRFWSIESMCNSFEGKEDDVVFNDLRIFVQDTEDRSGYVRLDSYVADADDDKKPDGVMVALSNGSSDRVKKLVGDGLEVIVDPVTCRLPYRDAGTTMIKTKLKLEKNKVYTARYIQPNLEEIAQKVTLWQKDATAIVLPYFAVRDSNDDYFQFNKEIWKAGRELVDSGVNLTNKKVYGGIALPVGILTDSRARRAMISHFLSKFNVDGLFVIFENNKSSIKSLDDPDLLEGMKEFIDAMSLIGEVVIAKSDMAILPLMRGGTFITSFSDSRRRFSYKDQFDSPSKSSGGVDEEKRKLKYYADPIMSFLEEKSTLEGLARANTELTEQLMCDCDYCEDLKPFEAGASVQHDKSEHHFYHELARIRNEINELKDPEARKSYMRDKVDNARELCSELRSKTFLTGEIIPNHEGLLKLIDV